MKFPAVLSAIRLCVVMLLTCTFLMTPFAEARHADEGLSYSCASSDKPIEADTGAPEHENHSHHAHNCGTCHIHLILKDMGPDRTLISEERILRTEFAENFASRPPGNPYRPPRA